MNWLINALKFLTCDSCTHLCSFTRAEAEAEPKPAYAAEPEDEPIDLTRDDDDDVDAGSKKKRLKTSGETIEDLLKIDTWYHNNERTESAPAGRKNLCDSLIETANDTANKNVKYFALAQLKCQVPNHRGGKNLEDNTCMPGFNMGDCPSVQTFKAISGWLGEYKSGAPHKFFANLTGVNGRQGCAVKKEDESQHCEKLRADEIDQTVKIVSIFLHFIAKDLQVPVLYFNIGGWAVKSIMEKVEKNLSDCDNVTVIVNGSHMQNWSYWAFGNPAFKNFEMQLVSVTNHVEAISTEMDNFFKTIYLPELDRHTLIEFASTCRDLPFVAERGSNGKITKAAYDAAKKQQHDQCVAAGKKGGEQSWINFSEGKTKQEIFDHYSAMGKEAYRKFCEGKSEQEMFDHYSAMGKEGGKARWAGMLDTMSEQEIFDHYSAMGKEAYRKFCEGLSAEERKAWGVAKNKQMIEGKNESTRKASGSSMQAPYIHPECGTCVNNWDNFGSNTKKAKQSTEGTVQMRCPTCINKGFAPSQVSFMSLEKFKKHHNEEWVKCTSCGAIRHAINKSGWYRCGNETCKRFGKTSSGWRPTKVDTEELGTPEDGQVIPGFKKETGMRLTQRKKKVKENSK